MNKELNPIEQLDLVLEKLNWQGSGLEHITKVIGKIPNNEYEIDKEYWSSLDAIKLWITDDNNELKISEINLIKVLKKLLKDEYIDTRKRNDNTDEYSITWEGRLFILNGGYMGDLGQKNALMTSSQNNESAIRALTRWIAFGTCGLLAWDITKYMISLLSCCDCHH
jgi:predicted transcriptional regulator